MDDVMPNIDPNWTVNELLTRQPATIPVLNQFGLDTCCGSTVSIVEAAYRDGVDLDALLAALRAAIAGA